MSAERLELTFCQQRSQGDGKPSAESKRELFDGTAADLPEAVCCSFTVSGAPGG